VSLFDGKSTVPERKYIPSDSPPKSPRIRPARSVESTVNDEGRPVEEMRRIIRKVLNDNLSQVQEVRFDCCYICRILCVIVDYFIICPTE
jgi:hypothetical protein